MPWNRLLFSCILSTWAANLALFSLPAPKQDLRWRKQAFHRHNPAQVFRRCVHCEPESWGNSACHCYWTFPVRSNRFPLVFPRRELSTFFEAASCQQVNGSVHVFSLCQYVFLFCIVAAKNTAQEVRTSRLERHTPSVQCCFQCLSVLDVQKFFFFIKTIPISRGSWPASIRTPSVSFLQWGTTLTPWLYTQAVVMLKWVNAEIRHAGFLPALSAIHSASWLRVKTVLCSVHLRKSKVFTQASLSTLLFGWKTPISLKIQMEKLEPE